MGDEHAIVKHWRQDWDYEPHEVLRFRGHGRFEREAVAPEAARGAWSQTVYDVDDAPRYAGIARWRHADGVDAWESDRTWRPLPRRDYSTRSDYQALDVVNRHTLTPAGWVHEQDNTKLALRDDGSVQAIARERGIDRYTRITDYDFCPGRTYWGTTQTFWQGVRAQWQRQVLAHPKLALKPEPNGEPRINALFALAERAMKGEAISDDIVRSTIADHVE